ncbi:MAG: DsrE/DsrF/TusD sulfur relay family protein [Halodesulfurarchaeum sp.]
MSHLGIVLTGAPFDSERWKTAYEMGRAALDGGHEVSIFAYLDGTYVPMVDQHFEEAAENGRYRKMPTERYQELLEAGAELFVCGICTDARSIDPQSDLPEGVTVGLLPDLADIIGEADRVISL